MSHPALAAGRSAVITGAALGIGRAAALRLAGRGLNLMLIDRDSGHLAEAEALVRAAAPEVTVVSRIADVSDAAAMAAAAAAAFAAFGAVNVLMNNAASFAKGGPWADRAAWEEVIGVNFWGVYNGQAAFLPEMIRRGEPGAVINTGSKQGITTPPGNAAYNVAKAAVKVITEQAAHELRQLSPAAISAHLLIPGYTFTGARALDEPRPGGAWSADQVAQRMVERVDAGDFYILCPDNEVTPELDHRRILWAAGDIVENRPALSRWHPDHRDAFARFASRDRKPS